MGDNRQEHEAATRISQALSDAVETFGTAKDAFAWLSAPIIALDGERPAHVAASSEDGLQLVRTLLKRIQYDVYS